MKEFIEELKYNQNVNIKKGLENRVDIGYVIERLERINDTLYDNGDLLLGKVKKIRDYTQKQFDNGLIDEEYKVDILNDLKDYKDDEIISINYNFGMGYLIDCWSSDDKIEESE